jgi:hypothetical protein
MRFRINQKLDPLSLISSHCCYRSGLYIFTLICILFLSEGQAGEAWELSNKEKLSAPPSDSVSHLSLLFPYSTLRPSLVFMLQWMNADTIYKI